MSLNNAEFIKSLTGKVVDFHSHFIDKPQLEEGLRYSVATGFGHTVMDTHNDEFRAMLEPDFHIARMDALGEDIHVITSCDVLVGRSWAEPQRENALCQQTNDCAAEWVERYPGRFVGGIHLPLGECDLALKELQRGVSLGLQVVSLSTTFRGTYLGDARFTPLWEALSDLGLPVFIHPDGVRDLWYQDYALWNSLGQSIEETRFMASMIYEGVMDRFPTLKIVMAHGGGYMPHYMGRLDRNYWNKPYTAVNLHKKPSEYLRDFYYDSCVYDEKTLMQLVTIVGADRIVMGGDFPVAGTDATDFLLSTPLSLKMLSDIGGKNAMQLLNRR